MNEREYFKDKLGEPMSETYETVLTGREVMSIAQECVDEALKRAKNNDVLGDVVNVSDVKTLKKGDYVFYNGGGKSKLLIKGRKYRLTAKPFKGKIDVINEKGVRTNTYQHFFYI
jgi:hypothetical protein